MKTQIGKWGNSLAIRIPKYVVEELSLESADEIDCRVENGKIVIELLRDEDDYTLEELLAMPLEREEEISWGKPEGEEIW
jgi:antitoxin MazE